MKLLVPCLLIRNVEQGREHIPDCPVMSFRNAFHQRWWDRSQEMIDPRGSAEAQAKSSSLQRSELRNLLE